MAVLFFATSFLNTSCKKEVSTNNPGTIAGQQKVTIYMNDDPANYSKVMVDIQQIAIKTDTGSQYHDDRYYDEDDDSDDDRHGHDSYGQWDTLKVSAGVYDLLRLRNGVDTLLASGYSWKGRISKIRLTLGTNNTVWTDATHSNPLTICEGKPYAYVKVGANTIDTLPGGAIVLRIDFDIAKSIRNKNGGYCLKPEIKAYSEHNSGSIEGKILPKDAKAMVTVFNATDTAYALPGLEGEYKIKGLKEGTYSVRFIATLPYLDTTLHNIKVLKGEDTKVATVTLRK